MEEADISEPSGASGAPTFAGQLQLQDFAYSNGNFPVASPRRSSRRVVSSPGKTHPRLQAGTRKKGTTRSNSTSSTPLLASQSSSSQPTTKKKRSRLSSTYAPPSTYAHLPLLPDAIAPSLLVLFVGLNPGIQTARSGHAYAHPSNLFWKLLFSSGVTPRPCLASEDRSMPELYSLGLTNIVARPSRNGAELKNGELDEGVGVLEEKVRRWRPESVCIVGKSIWESIWRVRRGRKLRADEFSYGWQDEGKNMGRVEGEWKGARVFVATSTSGLAATLSRKEKEDIWAELGSWVKTRRKERKEEAQQTQER